MQARDFCFWLQGYFEIGEEEGKNPASLTADQVEVIRRHLALVFIHEIDPSMGDADHQEKLNWMHKVKKEKPYHGPFKPKPTSPFTDDPGPLVMRC